MSVWNAGGFNHTNYFGGVWAYDLTQLTKPAVGWQVCFLCAHLHCGVMVSVLLLQSTTWISVVPDNNTALTAPPPMSGSSVVVYEGLLVLVRVA